MRSLPLVWAKRKIAGEEAEIGGEIMLGDDKTDLLKRISKNNATKDIFKSTGRKFEPIIVSSEKSDWKADGSQ